MSNPQSLNCSNFLVVHKGSLVSLSCTTEIILFLIFWRKEHWKQAFSLPISATAAVFLFSLYPVFGISRTLNTSGQVLQEAQII